MANKYQKINTLYKRYQFNPKECPNPKWACFRNQIIRGDFSNEELRYLYNLTPWECYSKIDGTNSRILFYPSDGTIRVSGKDDNSQSQKGQFEFLQEIADRIKGSLAEMFPTKEAKFTPKKDDATKQVILDYPSNYQTMEPRQALVTMEEKPIIIYGEYYGEGIQKVGKQYLSSSHSFAVFDINIQGWWATSKERHKLCQKLQLEEVPLYGVTSLGHAEMDVEEGFPTLLPNAENKDLIEEGLVCRPMVPLYTYNGERIIVKIKHCDYEKLKRAQEASMDFLKFKEWYDSTQRL